MELKEFFLAVLDSWVEKVGIFLTILAVIEKIPKVKEFLHEKPIIDRFVPVLWVIAAFCIIWGFYDAWGRERNAKIKAEQELAAKFKPDFELGISQANPRYIKDKDTTVVMLFSQLLNRGADSTALKWSAHYKSATLDSDIDIVHNRNTFHIRSADLEATVNPSDDMLDKTVSVPVPRAHVTPGVLFVELQGDRVKEIMDGDALITIAFQDYLGNPYSAKYKGTGTIERLKYYPGGVEIKELPESKKKPR